MAKPNGILGVNPKNIAAFNLEADGKTPVYSAGILELIRKTTTTLAPGVGPVVATQLMEVLAQSLTSLIERPMNVVTQKKHSF